MTTELFTVHTAPAKVQIGSRTYPVKGKNFAYSEMPNGEIITIPNMVSNKYDVHQPSEILEQFTNAVNQHGLSVERVLSNPANGGLMISAKYANQMIAGDSHDIDLVFYTSHDGKRRTFLTLQALRLACFNQAPMLARNGDKHLFSEKHYGRALEMETIGQTLASIPQAVEQYDSKLNRLLNDNLSFDDFISFLVKANKIPEPRAKSCQHDSKVEKWMEAYNRPEIATIPEGTKLRAYNAVTWLNTHDLRESRVNPTHERRLFAKAEDTRKMESLLIAA